MKTRFVCKFAGTRDFEDKEQDPVLEMKTCLVCKFAGTRGFEDKEKYIFLEMMTCLVCKFANTGGFEDEELIFFWILRRFLQANLPVPEVMKTKISINFLK